MNRNSAGALASLTANYTDSDGSDPENDGDDGEMESEMESGRTNSQNNEIHNTNDISSMIVDQNESATNSVSEMGHITDEEQGNTSDKDEIEDDDDDYVYANNRSKEHVDDLQIPPEPPGWCSKQLQEKIAEKYELMLREGVDLNVVIQNQKQFRNPSIYEKLIQFCQIYEMGTNYSPDVYDPRQFDNNSYFEELAKAQKIEMDRRQKEQKDRTKIEFLSGTKKPTTLAAETRDDGKKRKSKWDVAGNNVVIGTKPLSGIIPQPSVFSSVSSAKATVISAFGTITKKPN